MEKFHKVSKVATQLASLASEVSMKQFRSRYSTLEELVSNWEKGNKVRVIEGMVLFQYTIIYLHFS